MRPAQMGGLAGSARTNERDRATGPLIGAPVAGRPGPSLLRLWAIVVSLWTGADLVRLGRVRVPPEGWDAVLGDPATWLGLLVPPLILAAVLAGMAWLTGAGRRLPG